MSLASVKLVFGDSPALDFPVLRSSSFQFWLVVTSVWMALWFGTGCEKTLSPYESDLLQARFDKDQELKNPTKTVLRPQDLPRFSGLRYFPVDPAFRFELPLVPTASELRVTMRERRSNEEKNYLCVGYVDVPFAAGKQRLMVFQLENMPKGAFWIPFTDATSGKETYGGGRYLNVAKNKSGKLLVDFNEAYNPYCNYNPDYICTIPPRENRLTAAVRAGEMDSGLFKE